MLHHHHHNRPLPRLRTSGRRNAARTARLVAALGVLVAGVLATAGPAHAASPDNDAFADARVLTEPAFFNESQLTAGATAEPGEPNHGGRPAVATIWYRWTAPADVMVTSTSSLTLLDSDRRPAHALAFYTGDSIGALQEVVSAVGSEPGVTFFAPGGTELSIALSVRQRHAPQGNTHLFLYAAPPNDNLDHATPISGARGRAPGYVATATLERGEGQHSLFAAFGGTVWYEWTARTTGFTRFGVECCAGNQPVVAVYTGSSFSDLHSVASGFNCQVGPLNSCTAFRHVRGTSYLVAVQGDGTSFPLSWEPVSPACTITGTEGDDVLVGTDGTDYICGGAGNDVIRALGGDDVVVGGPGLDTVDYSGADTSVEVDLTRAAAFGVGADTLQTVEDVTGTRFDDLLTGDARANRLRGGGGNDRVRGNEGNDRLFGGGGDDTVVPGPGDDVASAGLGADLVSYSGSATRVEVDLKTGVGTGEGTDQLTGFEDVVGSAHDDRLAGDPSGNFLFGGRGGDTLLGRGGDDGLFGQAGRDTLVGGAGTDVCSGGRGRDTVKRCE